MTNGTLYQRNGRWWWRGRLPGSTKYKAIPLKASGQKHATRDRMVAEEVLRRIIGKASGHRPDNLRIIDLCGLYKEHADEYYRHDDGTPTKEPTTIRYALAPLEELYGSLMADEFAPSTLKTLRQKLVDEGKLCRTEINRRISIVKRMFRWAAAEEYVNPTVYSGVQAVTALKMNRTKAKDHPDIEPIDFKHVYAVFPFTTPVIRAMLELQMLTGMRPDELCNMTADRIDRSREYWIYEPVQHKTKYLGKDRKIILGPKAQDVLLEYLNRPGYLFSPAESEAFRLAKLRSERQTPVYGKRKLIKPRKTSDQYDTSSYYHAVKYAQAAAKKAGIKFESWTPYQIRHSVGTNLRDTDGLDATAAVLGHSDVETSKIYAKLSEDKAIEAAMKYG